jgi:hypothetical protein
VSKQVRAYVSLAAARLVLSVVKSRINARIRRNCNWILILSNEHRLTVIGFGRSILAVRPSILDFGLRIPERALTTGAS